MSTVDLQIVPKRLPEATAARSVRAWGKTSLRVFGGFVLTGVFLALCTAIIPIVAIFSFIWFAQTY